MKEIWKDIKGYEGLYKINIDGKIKNKKNQIIKPCYNKRDKIFQYHLYKNSKKKIFSRYKLIAEHFIPNPNNYNAIIHIDKDSTNDKVSNLKWINREETYFNGTENAKKIIYNNKIYNSIIELYKELMKETSNAKATYSAFEKRIRNNWDFKEAILIPPGIIPKNINGKYFLYKYKDKLMAPKQLYKIRKTDINKKTLSARLYSGWSAEEAIEIPVQQKRRK